MSFCVGAVGDDLLNRGHRVYLMSDLLDSPQQLPNWTLPKGNLWLETHACGTARTYVLALTHTLWIKGFAPVSPCIIYSSADRSILLCEPGISIIALIRSDFNEGESAPPLPIFPSS